MYRYNNESTNQLLAELIMHTKHYPKIIQDVYSNEGKILINNIKKISVLFYFIQYSLQLEIGKY